MSILAGVLLMFASGLGLPLVVLGGLGAVCILRGKRHLAVGAGDLLSRDTRPPVVYLRSFQADVKAARTADGNRFIGGFGRVFDTKTTEERLADALTAVGPVVAIGKPGEKLPMLGAARLYVDDEHWKATVHALMDRAALVVLLLGDTPGFWWELEHSIALDPTKLVLVVPFKPAEYEAFRQRTATHFPHPLPPYGSRIGCLSGRFWPRRGLGKLVGLIFFKPDWTPAYVDLTAIRYPWKLIPRYVGRQRLLRSLSWNLQPILAQLKVAWRPPRARPILIAGIVMLVALPAMVAIPAFIAGRAAAQLQHRRDAAVAAFTNTFNATPDQAISVIHNGWFLMSDEKLIDRAGQMEEMLKHSSAEACAGLTSGGSLAIDASLRWQDPAASERWFGLQAETMSAELRQAGKPATIDPQDLKRIYLEILQQPEQFVAGPNYEMPISIGNTIIALRDRGSEAAKEIFSLLEPGQMNGLGLVQVSYDDGCHVLINLHHAVRVLPAPDNARLARVLAYIADR